MKDLLVVVEEALVVAVRVTSAGCFVIEVCAGTCGCRGSTTSPPHVMRYIVMDSKSCTCAKASTFAACFLWI